MKNWPWSILGLSALALVMALAWGSSRSASAPVSAERAGWPMPWVWVRLAYYPLVIR